MRYTFTRIWLQVAFLCTSLSLWGQIGGDNVYEFLQLSPSARVAALGGNLITVVDDDVALAYQNPAALNAQAHQQLSFNYNFNLADITNGYLAYGHHIKKWNTTVHGGVQYINYGTFDAADERGNITGTFDASEYAFNIGASRPLYEKMTLGANLKLVTSHFESYQSVGLAADFAAMYRDTASEFNITLVFKNVGGQLSHYADDNREDIPFDLQLGISKKLAHLPLRLSIIAHNMHRWNILYDDPNDEQASILTGEIVTEDDEVGMWIDNLFRHVIFNGEFLLGKRENFRLRVGYNHLRRKELNVPNLRSLAGFSFGFGLKIKRFRVDYGREIYHTAGGVNHFSISTPLSRFQTKTRSKK